MSFQEIQEFASQFTRFEYALVLLVLFVVLAMAILVRKLKPKRVLAYSTESGQVMVSRAAIVELVQTSCEQIGDVFKPSVRIHTKGKFTHFNLCLKLASGGRMREIEKTLQTHLRSALTENLGIENVGRIDITATGFKSGKIERSPVTPKPLIASSSAASTPAPAPEPTASPEASEDLPDDRPKP